MEQLVRLERDAEDEGNQVDSDEATLGTKSRYF